MFVRYILLAILASSLVFVDCQVQDDTGPEEWGTFVVTKIEENIWKQLSAAHTYNRLYMAHARYLADNKETGNLLQQIIEYKNKNAKKLMMYAGSRGVQPNINPLEIVDLSKCINLESCWRVSLLVERDLYVALTSLYTEASSNSDVDLSVVAGSLVRDEIRSIMEVKRLIKTA